MAISDRVEQLRARRPVVDHAVRMVAHYGGVNGSLQAGAVTYFAFLSFFPLLALAFFVVGQLAKVYSGAQDNLISAIDAILPDVIGTGQGQISLDQVQSFSGWAGLIGLLGVLYAGLGWLSAMRNSLEEVFELPKAEQPGFVSGKLRDLVSMALIGMVLLVSVVVAGFVTGFSDVVLGWLHLSSQLGWLVYWLTRLVGLGANVVLFFAIFRLLAQPDAPPRALWSGALLGAVAFEVLKAVSFLLLGATEGKPAFQAFGIALILLVWINYFSRIVMYAASWAQTAPETRALRSDVPVAPLQGPRTPSLTPDALAQAVTAAGRPSRLAPFAAGGASVLGLLVLLRRLANRSDREDSA